MKKKNQYFRLNLIVTDAVEFLIIITVYLTRVQGHAVWMNHNLKPYMPLGVMTRRWRLLKRKGHDVIFRADHFAATETCWLEQTTSAHEVQRLERDRRRDVVTSAACQWHVTGSPAPNLFISAGTTAASLKDRFKLVVYTGNLIPHSFCKVNWDGPSKPRERVWFGLQVSLGTFLPPLARFARGLRLRPRPSTWAKTRKSGVSKPVGLIRSAARLLHGGLSEPVLALVTDASVAARRGKSCLDAACWAAGRKEEAYEERHQLKNRESVQHPVASTELLFSRV